MFLRYKFSDALRAPPAALALAAMRLRPSRRPISPRAPLCTPSRTDMVRPGAGALPAVAPLRLPSGKPQRAWFSWVYFFVIFPSGVPSNFNSLAGTRQPEGGGREQWAKRSLTPVCTLVRCFARVCHRSDGRSLRAGKTVRGFPLQCSGFGHPPTLVTASRVLSAGFRRLSL